MRKVISIFAILFTILIAVSAQAAPKQSPMKITVEKYQNPYMRGYHVNRQVSNKKIDIIERPYQFMGTPGKLNARSRRIAKALLGIEGVNEIILTPDNVDVSIEESFKWDEVEPSIKLALRAVFTGKSFRASKTCRPKQSCQIPIQISSVPNKQMRLFHLRQPVSKESLVLVDLSLHIKPDGLTKAGATAQNMVNRLKAIKGVNYISIRPYCVSVGLDDAFSWDNKIEMNDTKAKVVETIQEVVAQANRKG